MSQFLNLKFVSCIKVTLINWTYFSKSYSRKEMGSLSPAKVVLNYEEMYIE